jgi:hypothetical protein
MDGFRRTLDFLETHDHRHVLCFPLSVAPNTHFRLEAEKLGLSFQKIPPNLVISTPAMDFKSLRKGISLFRRRFCLSPDDGVFEKDLHASKTGDFPAGHYLHRRAFPAFYTHIQGRYPLEEMKGNPLEPLDRVFHGKALTPMTRILCTREFRRSRDERSEELYSHLSRLISWNMLCWFDDFDPQVDMPWVKEFLSSLSRRNPQHLWHILLAIKNEVPLHFLGELPSCMYRTRGILDFESLYDQRRCLHEYTEIKPFVYVLLPCGSSAFSKEWCGKLSNRVPLIWDLHISGDIPELPEEGNGFLVDFDTSLHRTQILYSIKMLKSSGDRRPFFFRNWILNRFWTLACLGDFKMLGVTERILELSSWAEIRDTVFSHEVMKEELMAWVRNRRP